MGRIAFGPSLFYPAGSRYVAPSSRPLGPAARRTWSIRSALAPPRISNRGDVRTGRRVAYQRGHETAKVMGPKSRLRALTATKMRGRSPHAHGSPGGGPPRDAARPRALRASHAHRGHAGRSHERVERGDIAVAQRFPSRDLCVHPTREVLEDIAHSLRGREVRAAHRAEQTRELRVELRRVVERVLAALRLD